MVQSASTSRLLHGAILPTLLRLAIPNVLALMMAVVVGIAETYYVGKLGTPQLAAMAIVFPFVMLTQMMSNGAMGGGVSSAISRALGAGDRDRAGTLALHALAIGAGVGAAYSLLFLLLSPALFRLLGGKGDVLAYAMQFGHVLFSGAISVWLCNTLAAVVRGTGNMRVPSGAVMGAAIVQVLVGGSLGLGLGPFPALGMTGVALGSVVGMGCGAAVLLAYLQWGQDALQVPWRNMRFEWPMFRDILRVGALACFSPVQSIATALIMTSLVARYGPLAMAGYGIGQRLEFLMIPVAFGVGVASVPMVGMAIGSQMVARARQVAWTAGSVAGVVMLVAGSVFMLFPSLWSGMFSTVPGVLDNANLFLRWMGPGFPFMGFGLALYFASIGSGHVLGPIMAGTVRLAVVGVAGWWVSRHGGETPAPLFAVGMTGMIVYGLATSLFVWRTNWGQRPS